MCKITKPFISYSFSRIMQLGWIFIFNKTKMSINLPEREREKKRYSERKREKEKEREREREREKERERKREVIKTHVFLLNLLSDVKQSLFKKKSNNFYYCTVERVITIWEPKLFRNFSAQTINC